MWNITIQIHWIKWDGEQLKIFNGLSVQLSIFLLSFSAMSISVVHQIYLWFLINCPLYLTVALNCNVQACVVKAYSI